MTSNVCGVEVATYVRSCLAQAQLLRNAMTSSSHLAAPACVRLPGLVCRCKCSLVGALVSYCRRQICLSLGELSSQTLDPEDKFYLVYLQAVLHSCIAEVANEGTDFRALSTLAIQAYLEALSLSASIHLDTHPWRLLLFAQYASFVSSVMTRPTLGALIARRALRAALPWINTDSRVDYTETILALERLWPFACKVTPDSMG
jgi:hypothetical protein